MYFLFNYLLVAIRLYELLFKSIRKVQRFFRERKVVERTENITKDC